MTLIWIDGLISKENSKLWQKRKTISNSSEPCLHARLPLWILLVGQAEVRRYGTQA
jgi:hypothetical protein